MKSLDDPFIQSLLAQFDPAGIIGIALVGSYSRNQQGGHSDVDLDIFVDALPDEPYTLRILDGKLVSLKYIRLRDEYAALQDPEQAIWAVPGLRRMKILLDEKKEIANLQQAAFDFKWEELQAAANDYAVTELMGCAEDAQKIIGGLLQENESKVMYASWGIFKNLTAAAAAQAGLMIESENLYFSTVQAHFGNDHPWTRAFRLCFGMDTGEPGVPAYKIRGRAALDLYERTAHLFGEIIANNRHREVIEAALQSIASCKQNMPA